MKDLLAWFAGLLAFLIPGFGGPVDDGVFFGYVEGDYVYVAPREGGTITMIGVADGDRVAAGDVLAKIDSERHMRLVDAARAKLAAAESNLKDMQAGSRREEIAVIEARLRAADSDLALARETLRRTAALINRKLAPQSQEDRDRAAVQAAEAAVNRLTAELQVARLPKRAAQIEAARQEVLAARAELENRKTDLADRMLRSPASGRVERVLRRQGEYAGPGMAVISVLPEKNIKIRFYVPEPERQTFAVGNTVLVGCTGCAEPQRAKVSFIAPEAEFTPPVLYSLEERARLVFLIEARFEAAAGLSPGQPVDVRLAR